MVKDGKYEVYEGSDRKGQVLARFEIEDGFVLFANLADQFNSRFEPGPMSRYTENLISRLMKVGAVVYLGKE